MRAMRLLRLIVTAATVFLVSLSARAAFDAGRNSDLGGVQTGQKRSGDYPVQPVPFTAVRLNDVFWAPRIETNRKVTIPAAFQQCEASGRVNNFERAAQALRGEPHDMKAPPYPFDDTDLYKVIEGASYVLNVQPDPKLDAYVDGMIAKIAAAQEPDGYIYTTRTIDPKNPHRWAGAQRWVNERNDSHELYNLGHLFEAAAAHYQATGKKTLLDVATRAADLLVKTFGPGKRTTWPGHQITEMALVKLYRVTGKEPYLSLAKFLLDERGPGNLPTGETVNPRGLDYNQAQLKVIDQAEPVGHAVRAMYMYAGMADVAAIENDAKIRTAGDRIWDNLVQSKLYLTGGIGAAGGHEGFGNPYDLPNMTAYNETCASIGMDYWNHRQFLLHGDAKYIDVMERTLFNGLISGVSLKGDTFFYPNPLESNGQHARQEWFGVACCPGNITRFLASVPGYIYGIKKATAGRATGHTDNTDSLYVNLFAGGTADVELGGGQGQDRAADPLSVGRRREDRFRDRPGAEVHGQRAHTRLGARAAGAERSLPVPRQAGTETDDQGQRPRDAADDHAGRLRRHHPHLGSRRCHRAHAADAGPAHRGAREGRGGSRSRRASARADRLRGRVAGQPERQSPKHRAGGRQRAGARVPRRSAERRRGD